MSDFGDYLNEQNKKEAAYNLYNYAAMKLENASIHCRLAEIKSQHDPLSKIIGKTHTTREQLYTAAYYVVMGRMPKE